MSPWELIAQGHQGLPRDPSLNYSGSAYSEWWETMCRAAGCTGQFCQGCKAVFWRERGSKEIT